MTTNYVDPNDRTTPRPCTARGCSKTFIPSRRGPVRDYCSPTCRKRLQRDAARQEREAPALLGMLSATIYGEPLDGEESWVPPRAALMTLSGEWGWTSYAFAIGETIAQEWERFASRSWLLDLIEEIPLGIPPGDTKRKRNEWERDGNDPGGDRRGLPPDVLLASAPGAPYGTGFTVRHLKDDHPEDVL